MPHAYRKRSARNSANDRAARFHRSGLGTTGLAPKQTTFVVTFVWGRRDLTPHRKVTTDRRKALRIARSIAADGARIVLVKKGATHASMKLIADFSTVGGAV